MLHMTSALLVNSNVDLELYLDQILPCIFSCLVGKRICSNPMEDHWSTRDCAAVVLASVVERYGKLQKKFNFTDISYIFYFFSLLTNIFFFLSEFCFFICPYFVIYF